MQKTLSALKDKINNALIVDRENHIYRCHRSIFTDQQLFDFEMKHIFEGNWVFLAHESQIAHAGRLLYPDAGTAAGYYYP